MALIEPFMVKTSLGTGADTAVELEAKTGESLLVKDVIIRGSDDDYVLLEVEKTTVGFFRVDGHSLGSHLPAPYGFSGHSHKLSGVLAGASPTVGDELDVYDAFGNKKDINIAVASGGVSSVNRFLQYTYANTPLETLIAYMIRKGWMRGYPVAEGQTFRVKPYTSGKKLNDVVIIYEKYDAGDIKATDVNGSEAKEYIFVNYGQPSSALTSSGDYEINTCKTTKEFPDFPFGKTVPSKTTIEVLGILGSESLNYSSSNTYTYTKYLKMFKGRTCLFDRDKNGLPFYQYIPSDVDVGTIFGEGLSVIGNYSAKDRREPFIPPTPLVFKEGEEVKVYITAGQGTSAGSISAEYAEVALIEKVTIAE